MKRLLDGARELGIDLTPEQLNAFEIYYRELRAWNARANLTTIVERDQVIVKHFLDSLSVAPILRQTFSAAPGSHSLIDIGSGAGFPGLPLKIVFPEIHVTLLEATRKKVDFLEHIIALLQLRNVTAIHARAEGPAHDPARREKYDAAVARAVADLATLLEYALPFVRVGGIFVAQKGIRVDEEIHHAARALETLGGRVREIVPAKLPGLEVRHLIVVEKIAATPLKHPRRAGVPAKKPIR